jgi:UDP-2,3-diacylglucosamine pyrophosphatase LpxH
MRENAMPTEVAASRLWVLSDLHLAPPGDQCVFRAHEALTSLLDDLAVMPVTEPPQWLLLNGDVFDYLQIPGYDELSLPLAVERTGQLLDALDAEPPGRNVVQALRRFTARGNRLSCMPGNHDPELNLAPVQDLLSARLGSTTALPPWAGEWRLEVAGQTVIGRHGHHDDAFNAISGGQMLRAQAEGSVTAQLPPGSRLVLQVINPFRRAKTADGKPRFPFIDGLPSEAAVVLAVMLLDPRLAAKRLPSALGIGAKALLRKALMSSGVRGQQLSEGSTTPTSEPSSVLGALNAFLGESMVRLEPTVASSIDYEVDAYFADTAVKSSPETPGLLAQTGVVRGVLLEALARSLMVSRSAFRSSEGDALSNDAMANWGQGRLAIAGHTHAARRICGKQGAGAYINTGTWIDQVVPPSDLSIERMTEWLEKLRRGEVPCWNGHPVGMVDDKGLHLLRWDGQLLQAWVDPL